jgi:hypothetical protein
MIIEASIGKSRRGRPRSEQREFAISRAQDHFAVERPMTLRHLWYLLLSDGTIKLSKKSAAKARADEDKRHYNNLSSWIVDARMEGVVPFSAIVDGLRESIKPSSWSGLEEFGDAVRQAYRKDLWARQTDYIEFWFEKDAIIGVIENIATKYDVKMRPLRGQSSLTFLHQAAAEIAAVKKPVFIYYFGDHDPSGYGIEDSARERLQSLLYKLAPAADAKIIVEFGNEGDEDEAPHNVGLVCWERLGFKYRDLARTDIMPLEAKVSDNNYQKFIDRFQDARAAELDALPTDEIRNRMQRTIEAHINMPAWKRLQRTEALEKESVDAVFAKLGRKA